MIIPYNDGMDGILESQLYCVLICIEFQSWDPQSNFSYSFIPEVVTLQTGAILNFFFNVGIVWHKQLDLKSISCTVLSLSFSCLIIMKNI